MIIFGTRGVTYSTGDGSFHCPQCGADSDYKKKRVRRFFTLYFIPLIPLDTLADYVECAQCEGTYKEDILSYDPAAENAAAEVEFHGTIRRVMVQMLLADGNVDPEEVSTVIEIYHRISGSRMTTSDVHQEIQEAQDSAATIDHYLRGVGPMLNSHGKEMVIKAAYMVAAADGVFQEEEKVMMSEIAKALDLSAAHYRGILADLAAEKQEVGV